MTPQDALKFFSTLAESALASGLFKNFAAAAHAHDAVRVLTDCVDTQIKLDKGLLVPVEYKNPTNEQLSAPNGPARDQE